MSRISFFGNDTQHGQANEAISAENAIAGAHPRTARRLPPRRHVNARDVSLCLYNCYDFEICVTIYGDLTKAGSASQLVHHDRLWAIRQSGARWRRLPLVLAYAGRNKQ